MIERRGDLLLIGTDSSDVELVYRIFLFAGVSYDPKVAGFVDYLGLGGCCLLEQASPDRLCSMVDDILQTTGEEYLAAAERLRSMASKNCEEVMALLNGNP